MDSYIYKGDDNCYYEHIDGKANDEAIEVPFELSENWCWTRLGSIIHFQGGYAYKSDSYVKKSKCQIIRLGNVKLNELIIDKKQVYISEEIASITADYLIKENDILVTMTGTRNKRDYFYSLLVEKGHLTTNQLFLNQRVGCIRGNKRIHYKYLLSVLQCECIKDLIFAKETGTANTYDC